MRCAARIMLVADAGVDVQCHLKPDHDGPHCHYIGGCDADRNRRGLVTWYDHSIGHRSDGLAGQAELIAS